MVDRLVDIEAGPHRLVGRLEDQLAPITCRRFVEMLPLTTKFIHVRWSGEGCWLPMGDLKVDLPWENATAYPAPGEMIFYPGGFSETEILLAYGAVSFASKLGALAGNHFLTVVEGQETLRELGRLTLWEGAQTVSFRLR
jgi:hypothetical protein